MTYSLILLFGSNKTGKQEGMINRAILRTKILTIILFLQSNFPLLATAQRRTLKLTIIPVIKRVERIIFIIVFLRKSIGLS